jgi:hypothetical protein
MMEISWHQNPLRTTFRLSDQEKELFRLQVKASQLEEYVGSAAFHLNEEGEDSDYFDPAEALKQLGYATDSDIGDSDYHTFLFELEQGSHIGDCTCFPASCMKCHAEYIFGKSTIEGLGKHAAHKIYAAFSRDETATIHDVIERLSVYEPVRSGAWLDMPKESFDQHVPRWKVEAQRALLWLTDYRDRHFPVISNLETPNKAVVVP